MPAYVPFVCIGVPMRVWSICDTFKLNMGYEEKCCVLVFTISQRPYFNLNVSHMYFRKQSISIWRYMETGFTPRAPNSVLLPHIFHNSIK